MTNDTSETSMLRGAASSVARVPKPGRRSLRSHPRFGQQARLPASLLRLIDVPLVNVAPSRALELRRALLHERHRALDEIVAAGHLLLNLRLELELLVDPRVEPVVELALGARVGARRPAREARRERRRL